MSDKRAYGTGRLFVKGAAWTGRWRTKDGGRIQRRIGPVRGTDALSKKQAEARLRELMLEQDRAPARSGRHDPTVAQLGRQLLARLEAQGRKRSHVESVRGHLRAHIEPALGSYQVSSIDKRDVAKLIDRMRGQAKSPKTIHNVIGTLHSLFGVAVEEEYVDRNPCDGAKLPVVRRSTEIRFLTQPEVERVLRAAPKEDASQAERDWWPVVRLLVLVATMTGMRLGELRALRWSDLDMAAMKVRVHQSFVRGEYGTPKSRRSARAIPLASRLVSELDEHHQSTVWNQEFDLVLAHPHTGRPLDRVRLLGYFKAALIRANVRPVRIHDLRHTFATTVAASGQVSLRTLQEWMGHENATTTAIYADYMPGEREAQLLDQAFAAGPGAQSVPNSTAVSLAIPSETASNNAHEGIPT